MTGLREVIESRGLFCALYSDRGSHFFVTRKAGEKVDPHRLTQVGRALKDLGVQMIPAYSPQARGRCERSFGTWQNRLPQELRLAGLHTIEQANTFLRERYIAEFNRKFAKSAAEKGTAFRKCGRKDLDWVFSIQTDRTVAQDNTVTLRNTYLQLDKTRFPEHLGWLHCHDLRAPGWKAVGALGSALADNHKTRTSRWKRRHLRCLGNLASPARFPLYPPSDGDEAYTQKGKNQSCLTGQILCQ